MGSGNPLDRPVTVRRLIEQGAPCPPQEADVIPGEVFEALDLGWTLEDVAEWYQGAGIDPSGVEVGRAMALAIVCVQRDRERAAEAERRRPVGEARACAQWSMDHCDCPSLRVCKRWAAHDAAEGEAPDA